nr:SLC26A/SulP transporter family protein [Nitrospirota bacterium]
MLVALPSSIAFGLIIYGALGPAYAAQGAVAGILGTIAIGIIAPLFGGTPRLISAPCAPAAAILAAFVVDWLQPSQAGALPPIQPEQILMLLTLVALLAGAMQFLFGVIGGGTLIKYIPYPVVAGYLSGVGLLILLGQLPKLLGLQKGTGLWGGLAAPSTWSQSDLGVGLVTIGGMLLAPKVTRIVPAPILGLAGGMAAYFSLGLWHPELWTLSGNAHVIGPIGGSGGSPLAAVTGHWSVIGRWSLDDLQLALMPALTLAVLLSIDTLKTCVVVDALTRSRHRSNRELAAQGLGNLASAVTGGIPGSGVMGATLVNINSGGQTRLSGLLEGTFALAVLLFLGSLVAWIPVAGLAGILIVVASRMVDRDSVRLLGQKSTILDFGVIAAVVVTAVSVNLIAAAGVGVGLAVLLFLREQIRGTVVRRKTSGGHTFSKQRRLPEQAAVLEQQGDRTAIYELQGSLFFGTTDQLFTQLESDLKRKTYVVLDMRRVQSVDFTAAHLLEQIEARLAEHKGLLLFANLPPSLPTGQDLQQYFDQVGLVKPSRNVRIFNELDDALEWIEDRMLEEAHLLQTGPGAPLALGEIDLLTGFDADTLTALGACAMERTVAAGRTIFNQGDEGDELFLVRKGSVRIILPLEGGKSHHLATFGRGDFFGDMAFLDRGRRSAAAVATTATDLYVLSRRRFDAVATDHPMVGRKTFARLARALAIRLRQTDAELRALEEA